MARVKGIKKRKVGEGHVYVAVVFRGYEVQPDGRRNRLEHAKTFRLLKDAERWKREQETELERGS